MILGVRPEALHVAPTDHPGAPAVVTEIEPLGKETIVSPDAGGVALTARVEGATRIGRDESVSLASPPEAPPWFDVEGERRLNWGAPATYGGPGRHTTRGGV